MSWSSFRRRGEILRAVIAHADYARDGRLPMQLAGVDDAFADATDLVGALQLKWYTRLAGQLERAVAEHPDTPEEAVVEAWRRTADALPGVRGILDHHRDHPIDAAMARALSVATDKEHALLATHALLVGGLSDPRAPRLGAGLERRARSGWDRGPAVRRDRGLVSRLRRAIAA